MFLMTTIAMPVGKYQVASIMSSTLGQTHDQFSVKHVKIQVIDYK